MDNAHDLSFIELIKQNNGFRKLPKSKRNLKGDALYPHVTFFIDSVTSYLEIIKIITSTSANVYDPEIIYRGMNNTNYQLIPSLGRLKCNEYNETYSEIEHLMVKEFSSLRPDAFVDLSSNFELLSKMQHYGLPTRLLDFTTNPLIALFFACEGNNDTDGRVVGHQGDIAISTNEIIEAVCGIHKQSFDNNNVLDDYLEQYNVSQYNYLGRIYRNRDFRLLLSRPKYWNERQQRQSSVFMIFPNLVLDTIAPFARHKDDEFSDHKNYQFFKHQLPLIRKYEHQLSIYPKRDPNIIEKRLGRKKCYDYTVTHHSLLKLLNCYTTSDLSSEDLTSLKELVLSKRFSFSAELNNIEHEILTTQFCSIVIKSDFKKSILKELETLGIDKAYIYPELQYTAEKIKNKYEMNNPEEHDHMNIYL